MTHIDAVGFPQFSRALPAPEPFVRLFTGWRIRLRNEGWRRIPGARPLGIAPARALARERAAALDRQHGRLARAMDIRAGDVVRGVL